MNLDRRHVRAMCLAGTVAVPQKMPQLARLAVEEGNGFLPAAQSPMMLVAEHRVSPKLTITRNVHLQDVTAVFVPDDARDFDLERGTWLLGDEIAGFIDTLSRSRPEPPLGIAYVREQAPVLMQVVVGMTAAESAEYYPPLPSDPAVDHYEIPGAGASASCSDLDAAAPRASCSDLSVSEARLQDAAGPLASCSDLSVSQARMQADDAVPRE